LCLRTPHRRTHFGEGRSRKAAFATVTVDFLWLFVCYASTLLALKYRFLVCYAATQQALQLQQERIQVVLKHMEARKRPARGHSRYGQ